MKPVPPARQPSAPGARLVTGRLLNQICEAIRARTPLNAAQSTAQGHAGAVAEGGAKAPAAQVPPRFDAGRTYVVPGTTIKRLAADLRARTMSDGVMRNAPMGATASGIAALLRAIEWISPDAQNATSPEGYRMPAGKPRVGSMTIEWEIKQLYADMCSISVDAGTQEYITKQTTVNVFENGSVTAVTSAAANIRTWAPGTEPTSCDATEYTNDTVDGFDYGAFVSTDYTEERHPFSDAIGAAVAGLPGAGSIPATHDFTWLEADWPARSATGGFLYSLGNIGCSVGSDGVAFAATFRWRIKNTGQCHIKLFWERHLQSDASLLASDSLDIARGKTSAWQDPPTTPTDPAASMYMTLSAIHLGPYR